MGFCNLNVKASAQKAPDEGSIPFGCCLFSCFSLAIEPLSSLLPVKDQKLEQKQSELEQKQLKGIKLSLGVSAFTIKLQSPILVPIYITNLKKN